MKDLTSLNKLIESDFKEWKKEFDRDICLNPALLGGFEKSLKVHNDTYRYFTGEDHFLFTEYKRVISE